MKRLHWLITAPLALILIVLAVNNRHVVDVSLWPFDFIIRWPLFVFLYIGIFMGFLAGAAVAWTSAVRRGRRVRRRQADKALRSAESEAGNRTSTSTGSAKPPALTD